MSETERRARLAKLTPRQLETLRLLCNGLDYQEVADELGVSVRTVENYGKAVLKLFGVSSRGAAIALALGRKKSSPLP